MSVSTVASLEGTHVVLEDRMTQVSVQPLIKGKWYLINGYGPFLAGSEGIEIPENEITVVQICICGYPDPWPQEHPVHTMELRI